MHSCPHYVIGRECKGKFIQKCETRSDLIQLSVYILAIYHDITAHSQGHDEFNQIVNSSKLSVYIDCVTKNGGLQQME